MELGLSLGDAAAATAPKPFGFMEKAAGAVISSKGGSSSLSFCMGLSVTPSPSRDHNHHQLAEKKDGDKGSNGIDDKEDYKFTSSSRSNTATPTAKTQPKTAAASLLMMRDSTDHHHRDRKRPDSDSSMDPSVPLLQLDLLPNTPVVLRNHHANLLWPSDDGRAGETAGSSGCMARGFDVNRFPGAEEAEDGAPAVSSSPPNSAASSFQMDFCMYSGNKCQGNEAEGHERASSRASDDDENGSTRKKLRLSKEQSAFLEESFKEHHTLNPKQKLALAKQLNLRPRQVEVWFQNRRARTKLKQTEVDCEYLKRCCETLTEENRRLHKELQELRALKTSNPFYMQLPATTLTMCPSCERVATTTSTTATPTATATATTNSNNNNDNNNSSSSTDPTTAKGAAAAAAAAGGLSLATSRPRFYPFSQSSQPHHHSHQSKAC